MMDTVYSLVPAPKPWVPIFMGTSGGVRVLTGYSPAMPNRHEIVARPSRQALRPMRLMIAAACAPHFVIHDLTIGNASQFAQGGGPIPGELFGVAAIDSFISLQTVQVAMDVRIVVEYIGDEDDGMPFQAVMQCEAIEPYEQVSSSADPMGPRRIGRLSQMPPRPPPPMLRSTRMVLPLSSNGSVLRSRGARIRLDDATYEIDRDAIRELAAPKTAESPFAKVAPLDRQRVIALREHLEPVAEKQSENEMLIGAWQQLVGATTAPPRPVIYVPTRTGRHFTGVDEETGRFVLRIEPARVEFDLEGIDVDEAWLEKHPAV